MTAKLYAVTIFQFTPIYITTTYTNIGIKDASIQAQNDLGIYNLIGPIISLILCFILIYYLKQQIPV